jgi:putative inorganic carbon (hco3(-)) transporter
MITKYSLIDDEYDPYREGKQICLNGGALALECILQRIYYGDYRGKLLFLIEPVINSTNIAQFGPFAYRSNAASYLNLIWPLGLGLFIQLGRENLDYGKRRIGNGPELLLIPCIILAASGPIISSSRGGTLVMIGLLILSAGSLMFLNVRSKFLRFSVSMALFVGLGTAYYLGWEKLEPRLVVLMQGLKGRSVISEVAIKMIDEYPVFGSGPGSFEALAQFELGGSFTGWESWVHNDYLEFYLTFGKAGVSLMCCILFFLTISAILILFFKPQKTMTWFGLMSLLGVGIHAAGDFPLQTLLILIPVCIITTMTSWQDHSIVST